MGDCQYDITILDLMSALIPILYSSALSGYLGLSFDIVTLFPDGSMAYLLVSSDVLISILSNRSLAFSRWFAYFLVTRDLRRFWV